MKESQYHLDYVDVAKGIGIIAVLCMHAGISGFIGKYVAPYYMPMFLVVSGIGYSLKRRNERYSLKRVKKISLIYFKYSMYVFAIALPWMFVTQMETSKILLNLWGILYGRKAFYPISSANNITWMDFGNGPMWFLPWYVTSWLFFRLLESKKDKRKIFITIVLLVVISNIFKKFPILLPWSVDTAPVGGIFIYTGTKYKKVREWFINFSHKNVYITPPPGLNWD